MGLASGTSKSARAVRDLLSASNSPELALLARLAQDPSIDLPRRGRVAILAGRIARGELSIESALRIAGSTPKFFATVLDMRTAGADTAPLDRVLEIPLPACSIGRRTGNCAILPQARWARAASTVFSPSRGTKSSAG